jgi:hypothetical protein
MHDVVVKSVKFRFYLHFAQRFDLNSKQTEASCFIFSLKNAIFTTEVTNIGYMQAIYIQIPKKITQKAN